MKVDPNSSIARDQNLGVAERFRGIVRRNDGKPGCQGQSWPRRSEAEHELLEWVRWNVKPADLGGVELELTEYPSGITSLVIVPQPRACSHCGQTLPTKGGA
jgi:hypothetical protein